jgi:hypothetical protein
MIHSLKWCLVGEFTTMFKGEDFMKKYLIKTLVAVLAFQAYFLVGPSDVQAQEETCLPPTPAVIDVKPGDTTNKINLSAKGLLPVAVLSTSDFDATLFTPEKAHLSDASSAMGCEGAAAIRWTYADVNGDGLLDLVFFFAVQDLNLTASTTEVMLMAHGTYNGLPMHIEGTASVIVKP